MILKALRKIANLLTKAQTPGLYETSRQYSKKLGK
jgi:hypothetical protein